MADAETARNDFLARAARGPVAKSPATFGEIWNSSFDAAGLDTLSGVGSGRIVSQAYDDLVAKVEAATGKPIYDAVRDLSGERLGAATTIDEKAQMIGRVVDTLPDDQRKAIDPLKDIRRVAADRAAAIEKTAAETTNYGLSGTAVAFAAGVARQAIDPVNLATLPLGGPLKGSLVKVLAREAAIGAGSQLVQEPAIQAGRADLGLESGFGEAAGNVAEAGLGAAGLVGVFRGAAAVMKLAQRSGTRTAPNASAPLADWDGQRTFTGHFDADDAPAFDRGIPVEPVRPLGDAPDVRGPGEFTIGEGATARPTRDRAPPPPPSEPFERTPLGPLDAEDIAAFDRGRPETTPLNMIDHAEIGGSVGHFDLSGALRAMEHFAPEDFEAAARSIERDHVVSAELPDTVAPEVRSGGVQQAADAIEAGKRVNIAGAIEPVPVAAPTERASGGVQLEETPAAVPAPLAGQAASDARVSAGEDAARTPAAPRTPDADGDVAARVGNPALIQDANRALADAGGDLVIRLEGPDGSVREVSARQALAEAEEDAAAAAELSACVGMELA